MDSKVNLRPWVLAVAASILSGAALYLSQGLQARWWPIWLAPLPLLWSAPRLPWTLASGAALVAGIIGGAGMWSYHERLHFPLWLQLATLMMPAFAYCAGAAVFRIFFLRRRFWMAALALPSTFMAYEYLVSLAFGTFGATAYTQLENLPVLQLATLTGLWGVSFAVMLLPSMLTTAILSPPKPRLALLIAFTAILGGTLTYGILRLSATPGAPKTITAGLVVSDLPKNVMPQTDEDAMRLMREYSEQVQLLSRRGASIVVLPEMTALVRDSISRDVDQLFRETAQNANVRILLGVLHETPAGTFNEARLYSESGSMKAVYRKHHLVPVVEGRTTPGTTISVVHDAAGIIGLAICRDMDYPEPARSYGQEHAELVLAPAWDFDIDRQWHGHMAEPLRGSHGAAIGAGLGASSQQ